MEKYQGERERKAKGTIAETQFITNTSPQFELNLSLVLPDPRSCSLHLLPVLQTSSLLYLPSRSQKNSLNVSLGCVLELGGSK